MQINTPAIIIKTSSYKYVWGVHGGYIEFRSQSLIEMFPFAGKFLTQWLVADVSIESAVEILLCRAPKSLSSILKELASRKKLIPSI